MSVRQAIPKSIRNAVKAKFDGRCAYCGQSANRLVIDHLVAVVRGGTNEIDNLMPSCFSCNNFKMSFSLEQFREELRLQVHRARAHSLNFRLAERFGLIEVKEKPIKFYFEEEK